MQYLFLLYDDESGEQPESGTPEWQAEMARWWAFDGEVREAGVHRGGEALYPTESATTVQVVDGDTVTTDGPFAETAEQLGGYYLLECADIDEAIRWAVKIPTATSGGRVEIRPVVDMADLAPPEGAGQEGASTG